MVGEAEKRVHGRGADAAMEDDIDPVGGILESYKQTPVGHRMKSVHED